MSKTGKGGIILRTTGGDAWTWQKRISGKCTCKDRCGVISVWVNGTRVKVTRRGAAFSAPVPLSEGKNRIAAYCRHADGRKCDTKEIAFRVCLKRRPRARLRVHMKSAGVLLDGRASSPDKPAEAPIVKYLWRAGKDNPSALRIRPSPGASKAETVLLKIPRVDGEYYFSLKVIDAAGRSDTSTTYFVVEKGKPRLVRHAVENPAWVESAVIYGVVPHNFGPRGFRSVTEKLDYLRDLGINALWLSPCTQTPTGGHGYAVSDYFSLRRDYGTKADFRKLVKEAHARGIRVLMDFVPNHSSLQHRYMRHAQAHGKASPYYDFYDRNRVDAQPTHYFNWVHLPNINYDNPEARRWMMEAFSYWGREFDVDGFRVDAAWGIRLRRPDFWPQWRSELKRIKPDLLLLAEASARDPYYFDNGFDAAYDWTEELGHWSMEKVFKQPGRIISRLHDALTNERSGFHPDALIFRFLNNNDTGIRFITNYGLKMEKVAAAMLLTLPGLPCIYTGQEVGAEFEPYKTPQPISWQDKWGLRAYYRKLIHLRRRLPSLHSRSWDPLKTRSAQQVYAYLRYGSPEEAPVLVALNFGDEPAKAEVSLPARFPAFTESAYLKDLLSGDRISISRTPAGALRMEIPPSSGRILVPLRRE